MERFVLNRHVALHQIHRVEVLGVEYDNLSRTEALDRIEAMMSGRKRNMICTPNADHIVRAHDDVEFRQILKDANLVLADGMAVIYASWFLRTPLKQNIGGRLIMDEIARRSMARDYRLFLLGGSSPEVLEMARYRLLEKYTGCKIAGYYCPKHMKEFDDEENRRMVDLVNSSKADIVFVGLGMPKQEKWIYRNLQHLSASVSIGVGVAIDMFAGRIRRPPNWMTNIGLEWLHRLIQEPARLSKRYLLNDTRLFWWLLRQRLASKGCR